MRTATKKGKTALLLCLVLALAAGFAAAGLAGGRGRASAADTDFRLYTHELSDLIVAPNGALRQAEGMETAKIDRPDFGSNSPLTQEQRDNLYIVDRFTKYNTLVQGACNPAAEVVPPSSSDAKTEWINSFDNGAVATGGAGSLTFDVSGANFVELEFYVKRDTYFPGVEKGKIAADGLAADVVTLENADGETAAPLAATCTLVQDTYALKGVNYAKLRLVNEQRLQGASLLRVCVAGAEKGDVILDNFSAFRYALPDLILDRSKVLGGNGYKTDLPETALANENGFVFAENVQLNGLIAKDGFRMDAFKPTAALPADMGSVSVAHPFVKGELVVRHSSGAQYFIIDALKTDNVGKLDDYIQNYIKVYPSADNETYGEAVELSCTLRSVSDYNNTFARYAYANTQPLPEGTKYLKISIQQVNPKADYQNQRAWDPLIDSVRTFSERPAGVFVEGPGQVKKNDSIRLSVKNALNYLPDNGPLSWSVIEDGGTGAALAPSADGRTATFTAIATGTALVAASCNGVMSDAFPVEVLDTVAVTDIAFSTDGTPYQNREILVKAVAEPVTADMLGVEWSVESNAAKIVEIEPPEGAAAHELYAVLTATEAGPVTVRLKIGDYSKDFAVEVKPVVEAQSVELEIAELYAGLPAGLSVRVEPENATFRSAEYFIVDQGSTAQAEIDAFGVLLAATPGTLKLRAVLNDGTDSVFADREIVVKPYVRDEDAALKYVFEGKGFKEGDQQQDSTEIKVPADAATELGLYEMSGSVKFSRNRWTADGKPVEKFTAAPSTAEGAISFTFCVKGGFSAFEIDWTVLDDGDAAGVRTEATRLNAYREAMAKGMIRVFVSGSRQEEDFYEVPVAGRFNPSIQHKGEEAWPYFDILPEAPVRGAEYLKIVITPMNGKPYSSLLGGVKVYRSHVAADGFALLSSAPENESGVRQVRTGKAVPLYLDYYNDADAVFTVAEQGAVVQNGAFTAEKAGTYTITAEVGGFVSAPYRLTAEEGAVANIELTLGSETVENGGSIAGVVRVTDQFGDTTYLPEDLAWKVEQGEKGAGSADFTAVQGTGVQISCRLPADYCGTLVLTASAGGKNVSRTVTVNKVSLFASFEIEGGNTVRGGGKVTVRFKALDQYGEEIVGPTIFHYEITGENFKTATGNEREAELDLTDFTGALTVKVSVKATAASSLVELTQTLTVERGEAPAPAGCGCGTLGGPGTLGTLLILGAALAAMLGAGLALRRKRA